MSTDSDIVENDCSVRVAVRIRPQNSREIIDMCRVCTTVAPGEPQIQLGVDKAFTFDFVFDINSNQSDIYTLCVDRLVEGSLKGYNATVLAYGQTGSGKTYTMGTGFDHSLCDYQLGIIPRAVRSLFAGIQNLQSLNNSSGVLNENSDLSVGVQFIELYNEEIIDLLDPYNKGRSFKINENINGQITITGATIKPVFLPEDALKYLQQGALARTTASTKMNEQSSRSHAIFTLLIRRQRVITTGTNLIDNDIETLTSKFNFVDLAGSERLKRTLATGDRAREGISINCGLLALGNCISALGDKSKRATHIPYRDSKLTRLLQDSLGGNSQTLMIACVSPSDRDFMETLNTLKYANRARNIKNKIHINQDHSSRTISQLRREIAALQLELLEYKQGKRLIDSEGNSSVSDTFHENAMLLAENMRLQHRLKSMQETINVLTERNTQLRLEKETKYLLENEQPENFMANMVANYINEIEKLQAKLIEAEEMYQQLKKSNSMQNTPRGTEKVFHDPEEILNIAKKGLEQEREILMSRSLSGVEDTTSLITENNLCESEDTDSESEYKTNDMQADLNDINFDIEIKTKLIEQLELSQERMRLMRQHYEEKFNILNCKISNTEKERDEVIANMGASMNQPNDKIKKVREEYERKINDIQRELRRLQNAQREHIRQQRELKAQEAKLQNLRMELNDLKCSKTKLLRKISDQATRHKEENTRKTREIAQLRKEQRRQQNTVLSLQAKMNAKEQILKRRTEEIRALRHSKKAALSLKASGCISVKGSKNTAQKPYFGRQQWDNLCKIIAHAARNKQLITQLERELDRLMKEREDLSQELCNIQSPRRMIKATDVANEEDTIRANLSYIQESIGNIQQAIMEFEEVKDTAQNERYNIQNLIENICSINEAKYLLRRLTDNAVMLSCNSALTEIRLQEQEALLREAEQESEIQQQLLQHFISQNSSIQISDLFDSLNLRYSNQLNLSKQSESQTSLHSNGTYDIAADDAFLIAPITADNCISRSPSPVDIVSDKNTKIRRRTAQRQDLLFGQSDMYNKNETLTRSFTQLESQNRIPLMRIPSAPGSLKTSLNSTTKKIGETSTVNTSLQSPELGRKTISHKKSSELIEDDTINAQHQTSSIYRKTNFKNESTVRNNDVFSRLGVGTYDPLPGGSIHKASGKIRSGIPLYCTHTISGHNNSVLSIKVDKNILYSASIDRTVKVWDLSQETVQCCLRNHPGPVIAVQNDPVSRLIFSASGSYVRVWDLRTSSTVPIKTISSSGHLLFGNETITRTAVGEHAVSALYCGPLSNLYIAASDKVRIWDIKSMSCIGKLSGGHQAPVMCITAWRGYDCDFVATGSKDHYVKVFEVSSIGGNMYPRLNLEPPHYDGVQTLLASQDAIGVKAELFSGSRDSGIKRWDLQRGEIIQSLNNAHKGWVSGMAIIEDILLSSCRGGVIRLWNIKSFESISELKTDMILNDIIVHNERIFTASSDGKVCVWRLTDNICR